MFISTHSSVYFFVEECHTMYGFIEFLKNDRTPQCNWICTLIFTRTPAQWMVSYFVWIEAFLYRFCMDQCDVRRAYFSFGLQWLIKMHIIINIMDVVVQAWLTQSIHVCKSTGRSTTQRGASMILFECCSNVYLFGVSVDVKLTTVAHTATAGRAHTALLTHANTFQQRQAKGGHGPPLAWRACGQPCNTQCGVCVADWYPTLVMWWNFVFISSFGHSANILNGVLLSGVLLHVGGVVSGRKGWRWWRHDTFWWSALFAAW